MTLRALNTINIERNQMQIFIIIVSTIMISIDKIIKILIINNFINNRFNIIGEYVSFYPKFNLNRSWYGSIIKIDIGRWPHIIFLFIVFLIVLIIIKNILKYNEITYFKSFTLIFLISGVASSLLDAIIWGASLDYIRIKGFFIFDLKDLYISIFEIFFYLTLIKFISKKENREIIIKLKTMEFIKIISIYLKF